MKRSRMRWWTLVATVLGGATVFQSVGFTATEGLDFSCNRFVSNGVLSTTNFCFLLDCENGFLGGLVDPCNDPSQGGVLLDCEGGVGGTGTSGTDDTDDTTDTTTN